MVAVASLGVGWLASQITGGVGLFTVLIAVAVALVQLAVIEMR